MPFRFPRRGYIERLMLQPIDEPSQRLSRVDVPDA
jgi:hypothetical protein